MEFGFTPEQERLRREVHDWFVTNLPQDYEGTKLPHGEKTQAFERELARKVGAKGWLTAGWPREYGGLGLGDIESGIIKEEIGRWKTAWANYTGIDTAGPAMLHFASEQQKRQYLPPIARGEVQWDQLFTEPNAGSDEANVQTRAVVDGDDFVINGQKMFVGDGMKPDWLFTLVKTADTEPKRRGLSLIMVPGDAPGLTYQALPCLGGWYKEEIFFDDVRVPKENLIGELNRGFYHAMQVLALERTRTYAPMNMQQRLKQFVWYCKQPRHDGKRLWNNPAVRRELAEIAADVEIWRLEAWRSCAQGASGGDKDPLGYGVTTIRNKTGESRHYQKLMRIMGLYGQLILGSQHLELRGQVARRWEYSRSAHPGGTPEIFKVVAAERVLGLPRRR